MLAISIAVKRPSLTMLKELESTAVRVARAGGEHIMSASTTSIDVKAKKARAAIAADADLVSNVDLEVERLICDCISREFPSHTILGEECDIWSSGHSPFVWIVDPIDGTTNYLNGLPIYGCSVGVLYQHFPVVGAVWCAMTHAWRPGVYHAFEAGCLSFDGAPIPRRPMRWRGVASEPGAPPLYGACFDTRVLASASLECAFAAAGMLRLAYISSPAIWDVAAGISLARAAGCCVLTKHDQTWTPFNGFTPCNARKVAANLMTWRQPVLIGDARAVDHEAALNFA